MPRRMTNNSTCHTHESLASPYLQLSPVRSTQRYRLEPKINVKPRAHTRMRHKHIALPRIHGVALKLDAVTWRGVAASLPPLSLNRANVIIIQCVRAASPNIKVDKDKQ